MNKEDIIRMAREAGAYWQYERSHPVPCVLPTDESLERFFHIAYAAGAAAEREACACIAETAEPYRSADLIRKRGQA